MNIKKGYSKQVISMIQLIKLLQIIKLMIKELVDVLKLMRSLHIN